MEAYTMKSRILSVLLILSLLLSLTVPAMAEEAQTVTLDIGDGSIVITETGYTQGSAGEETAFTGDYVIAQADPTPSQNTILVKSGSHTITLKDKTYIDVSKISNACAFSVTSGASAALILKKACVFESGSSKAGLNVPAGASLTISATGRSGSLNVIGGYGGAGIGGNSSQDGGNITILSSTIIAKGGSYGAGIGGGNGGDGTGENGKISIQGGTVKATGGSGGAGIGAGSVSFKDISVFGTGTNGTIEIIGSAAVTAQGGFHAAGIGGGSFLWLGGGTGYQAYGTGKNGTILISGNAVVTATGGTESAGIGGGSITDGGFSNDPSSTRNTGTGENGAIIISGNAHVEATAGADAAAIGGGYKSAGTETSGSITVTDNATVVANATTGAAIGGGNGYAATGSFGSITISKNANVTAVSESYAAIGGSRVYGSIYLSGGTVKATGSTVGIGGAYNAGAITVTGGKITATGTYGIGCGTLNLYGGTLHAISTGEDCAAMRAIAATGFAGDAWVLCEPTAPDLTNFLSGVLFNGPENGMIYSDMDYYELPEDKEIPEGFTLTVQAGQELYIPEDTTLYVNGTLIIEGDLIVEGQIVKGENGVIIGWGEEEPVTFEVAGTTMTLGNDLALNFMLNTADITGTDWYAEIAHGDQVITVPQSDWVVNGNYTRISYNGVAAKEMVDEVTVSVRDAKGSVLASKTDSVRGYAMRMFGWRNDFDTVLADMLNYGAAAQVQFNYKTDDLANSKMTEEQKAKATESIELTNIRETCDGYLGATLELESNIVLNFIYSADFVGKTATVSYTDHYGQAHSYETTVATDGKVSVDKLVVSDCSVKVTVTIDGVSVVDSVESYCARMQSSLALAEPLMKFAASARAYFSN